MKYLGIDYGIKRVGIAVSDEDNKVAFPLDVLSNDKRLIQRIKQICAKEKIESIVLGESKDFGGENNSIMKDAKEFCRLLKKSVTLPLHWEPEFYTSAEAERLQGKHGMLDASAAAIILKSYLDKKKNKVRNA
jgi:putative Holliday junction resolvase